MNITQSVKNSQQLKKTEFLSQYNSSCVNGKKTRKLRIKNFFPQKNLLRRFLSKTMNVI